MPDVTVKFVCGHEGHVTDALFYEGEEIPLPCRECKPSRIVALLWLGTSIAFGVAFYGLLTWNELIAAGGAIGIAVSAVFLVIFSR